MPLTPYPSQFFTRSNALPIAGQAIPKMSVLTWAELDTSLLMLNQKINDTVGLNIGPFNGFGVYHSKTYAPDNGTLNFYSLIAGSGITIVDEYSDATLTLTVTPEFCERALTAGTITPCTDCGIKFERATSGYTFPIYGPATTGQTLVLAPPAAQTGGCSNQLMWGTVSSSATVFTDLYVDSATWGTNLGGHPTIINIHRNDGVQWNLQLSGETPYTFNESTPDYTGIRPRLGENISKGQYANVAGGQINFISPSNNNASIGGGSGNTIHGSNTLDMINIASYNSAILNGKDNLISSAATSVILGGDSNRILNPSGADANPTAEDRSGNLIGPGTQNLISGASHSSIMGGTLNTIRDITHSFIGGGYLNVVTSGSTDSGNEDYERLVRGFSSILGGWYNAISGESASIVGGSYNKVQTTYGSILAGNNNNVNAIYGVILNASANTISPTASASTISAGVGLTAYSSETTYTRGLDAHTDITQALGGVVNTEHRPFKYHGNYASPGYGKFLMSNSDGGHAKWVSLPFIPSGITNVSGGCYMASAYTSGCTVYMTLTGGTVCQGAVLTANTCSNLGPYQYGAGTNSIKPVLGTNTTVGDFSTVQGGLFNTAPGTFDSIVNGISNDVEGIHDFIGNGQENKILNTVAGESGYNNYHRTILNGYSGYNASVRGGTILNGDANYLEDGAQWSTIINGKENRITGNVYAVAPGTSGGYNLIGNGSLHRIISGTSKSTILNGYHNQIISANTVSILGGQHNSISGESNNSVIVGGKHNLINSPENDPADSTSGVFIGAGYQNQVISGVTSGIVGGHKNYISGATGSFIGGGSSNQITELPSFTTYTKYSSIVGGYSNFIAAGGASNFIGGGGNNDIRTISNSSIVGGVSNKINQDNDESTPNSGYKSILGGYTNHAYGLGYDVILGGSGNTINAGGNFNLIGNGRLNVSSYDYSTILNGQRNTTTAIYGTVLGGSGNTVSGNFGHIVGGTGNTINARAVSSAIIGCNDLTADQANTTYMCGLTAGTISATTVLAWNVPQKYVDTRNYTANVAETITHNLDTQDVVVNIWDTATSQRIDATIQYGTLNTLTVELTMNKDNIKTVIIG